MATPISFTRVKIESPFWDPLIAVTRSASLPLIHSKLKSYGSWDAMRLTWKPGDLSLTPDILWDSDIAKYIEAAAYALHHEPDNADLKATIDEAIEMILKAQQPDGYIGIYHTIVAPEKRWSSLAHNLELYGGGHLLEAAVGRHIANGRPKDDAFLAAMVRYVELLKHTFGPGPDQRLDYPGHQEIELALMRLYDETHDAGCLELARFFLDERGRTDAPRDGHAWDLAAVRRGDDPETFFPYYWPGPRCYWHMQAHAPLREQKEIVGHAVQAMYWLSSVTDVGLAVDSNEGQAYLSAADALWQDMVERKMYVTGGIGSVHLYEGFGPAYDLPNETSYAETCAGIGILFLAQRKLKVCCDGAVADVMERALYNAVLAGLALDGRSFNYDNPLATVGCEHSRRDWFKVFCCPSNICRLLNSLGGYLYGEDEVDGLRRLTVHLYIGGKVTVGSTTWHVESDWPWQGRVKLSIESTSKSSAEKTILRLRIPSYATSYSIKFNDNPIHSELKDGYISLPAHAYTHNDILTLDTPFTPVHLTSHPLVHQNRGCLAIRRGPLIYAVESIDQTAARVAGDLRLARIDPGAALEEFELNVCGAKMVGVKTRGWVVQTEEQVGGGKQEVVRTAVEGRGEGRGMGKVELQFIPYFAWGNRGKSDMRVWIAKGN